MDTGFLEKTDALFEPENDKNQPALLAPNPVRAGDWVYFTKNPNLKGKLQFSDSMGKLRAVLPVENGRFRVPDNLPNGMYFAKIGNNAR